MVSARRLAYKYGVLLALLTLARAAASSPVWRGVQRGLATETEKCGHIRVYKRNFKGWDQLGSDIDGSDAQFGSGYSVSLSSDGGTVAVGMKLHDYTSYEFYDDASGSEDQAAAHVRVYRWVEPNWQQLGTDILRNSIPGRFGWSVSLSGDGSTVAIGAPTPDTPGQVRVYRLEENGWNQLGGGIEGEEQGDFSGVSVSLSFNGTVLAIGASKNSGTGHVRVYSWNETSWNQRGGDLDGKKRAGGYGRSVSLSSDGEIVAVGGPWGGGNYAGVVRVYSWNGTTWGQRGDIVFTDGKSGDYQGHSVSLSAAGTTLAIGAPKADIFSGRNLGVVRVYNWTGVDWIQLHDAIGGYETGDGNGHSVSLSSDGTTLAMGAPSTDSEKTGYVRVYGLDGGAWVQLGSDVDGEGSGDQSGVSVSLSGNGEIVAIGAHENNNACTQPPPRSPPGPPRSPPPPQQPSPLPPSGSPTHPKFYPRPHSPPSYTPVTPLSMMSLPPLQVNLTVETPINDFNESMALRISTTISDAINGLSPDQVIVGVAETGTVIALVISVPQLWTVEDTRLAIDEVVGTPENPNTDSLEAIGIRVVSVVFYTSSPGVSPPPLSPPPPPLPVSPPPPTSPPSKPSSLGSVDTGPTALDVVSVGAGLALVILGGFFIVWGSCCAWCSESFASGGAVAKIPQMED